LRSFRRQRIVRWTFTFVEAVARAPVASPFRSTVGLV
jgi:hypothetical protein